MVEVGDLKGRCSETSRWIKGLAASFTAILILASCASAPEGDPVAMAEYERANDPYEPMNRAFFSFNAGADRWVIRPLAEGYRWLLPKFVRDAINGILNNAGEPVNIANAALQGNAERAATSFGRLAVNSTVGLAGMIDVASNIGLEPINEDFGQTLAVWGGTEGAYLVLPVFGPSSVRDGLGRGGDVFLNPLTYLFANNNIRYAGAAMTLVRGIDLRARNIEILDEIQRTSVDYYATLRSLYRQRRQDLINNGEPVDDDIDPFFGEPLDWTDDGELSLSE